MAGEKMAKPATAAKSSDSNLIAALCYIFAPWVSLFVMLTEKKEDKFALYHAWQALVLVAVAVVYCIGIFVVSFVVGLVAGPLVCIFFPLYFVPLIAALFAAYKAYQGERYKLPVIGNIAEGQAMK